jgi:hypothetical protein
VSPEASTDTFLNVAKSFFSDGVYNWGRVGSKEGPRFPMPYFVVMFNDLKYQVTNVFVDIGEIINHPCLNFLFKIESVSAVLYPRWPPLLKIEISSNGQNCSILNQKVPKFELSEMPDTILEEDHPRIISAKFD